jgi:hypothetical protein
MAQKHLRVLLGFTRLNGNQLVTSAGAVIQGMTGNKWFPSPPVTLEALQTAVNAFNLAITAQALGGTAATAEKKKKRLEIEKMLRKLVSYVQATCDDDLTVLLSSGFAAAGQTRTQSPLPKPVIRSVDNGHTSQLLINVGRLSNARTYEIRCAPINNGGAPGAWQSAGAFTFSRAMPVNGLTPGTMYSVQARAIGGSTGYSDWSDPVAHMCM